MGDVMDSTLMHFNKGRTGEDTNGAFKFGHKLSNRTFLFFWKVGHTVKK